MSRAWLFAATTTTTTTTTIYIYTYILLLLRRHMSKDKTRSIRLDGDVGAKAQELADDGMLSATLSSLLRNHFGMTTEIDAAKNRLNELVNQRYALQQEADDLADWIDQAETELITRSITEKPRLEAKLKEMKMLHDSTQKKLTFVSNPYEKNRITQVLFNQREVISKLEKQLEEFL